MRGMVTGTALNAMNLFMKGRMIRENQLSLIVRCANIIQNIRVAKVDVPMKMTKTSYYA